jgi:hypothetical protein
MNNREAKRWRHQYRKKIDSMANMALKKKSSGLPGIGTFLDS